MGLIHDDLLKNLDHKILAYLEYRRLVLIEFYALYIAKKLINMEGIYIYDRKEKYRVFGFIPETANLYLVSSEE